MGTTFARRLIALAALTAGLRTSAALAASGASEGEREGAQVVARMTVGGYQGDTFVGGPDPETFVSGGGDDRMTGGGGGDYFVFGGNPNATALTPDRLGNVVITDFEPGVDKIVLPKGTFSSVESSSGVGFSKANEFKVVAHDSEAATGGDFGSGTAGGIVVYSSESGHLFYNENGVAGGFGRGGTIATIRQGGNALHCGQPTDMRAVGGTIPSLRASDFQFLD
jgi:Ca2+-binding RTX toxin-like protein